MKVIIFNWPQMNMGGIETLQYSYAKKFIQDGCKIVWMWEGKHPHVAQPFKDIFNTTSIKFLNYSTRNCWFKLKEDLDVNDEDEIVFFSWAFFDHIRAHDMGKRLQCKDKKFFLFVPHFKERFHYPDEIMPIVFGVPNKIIGKMYQQWVDAGEVIFCSESHIKALESKYGIYLESWQKRMAPSPNNSYELSPNAIRRRYENNVFRIVTAGRDDFPHKGFVVGLIKTVNEFILSGCDMELNIVGFSPESTVIKNVLKFCGKKTLEKTHFYPIMSYEKLQSFYDKCNLCVAVAGCAFCAGSVGLVTLPARHYHYECEVYGFLPDAIDFITSCAKGYPLARYIDEVYNMQFSEYEKLSISTYNVSKEREKEKCSIFTNLQNYDENYAIAHKDYIMCRLLWWLFKICEMRIRIKKSWIKRKERWLKRDD